MVNRNPAGKLARAPARVTLADCVRSDMLAVSFNRPPRFPLSKKKLFWSFIAVAMVAIAAIQFVPAPALVVPAELPADQRAAHRLLNFEGIPNFRDLGGYPTADGRQVKWGVLYRSGTFAESSKGDLKSLAALNLNTLIDFRSAAEKELEPNQLPDPTGFTVVEIPTLDDGNQAMVAEITERIETSDFEGFDPNALMLDANRQFASTFTPQFRQFMQTILQADGAPVVWHCTAGKDRTGFASAILLRTLGVPQEVVMQDYMASKQNALEARKSQVMLLRLFKGDEAADKVSVMLGVEKEWLAAAFEQIDATWGSFENYVHQGLQLSDEDIAKLKATLLTPPATGV